MGFLSSISRLYSETILSIFLSQRSISLQDLISRNSQALLDGKNQVYCGKCGRNTSQRSSCSFENSIVLIEIVRVLTFRGEKSRNNSSVYFPLTGISLRGALELSRLWQLVTTEGPLILDIGFYKFICQMALGLK